MKKIVILLLLVAVVAGGGYAWYRYQQGAKTEAAAAETEISEVTSGPLVASVQCTGRVVSNQDVDIKCKASGLVINMPHDISEHVNKGDLLLELDPIDQQRTLQQTQAQVNASAARVETAKANLVAAQKNLAATRAKNDASIKAAQARVDDARAKAKREKEMLAAKQTSVEEAETAETTARTAEQDLASAQAQTKATEAAEAQVAASEQEVASAQAQLDEENVTLALAQQRLGETKVYAPIDGVISSRPIQPGTIIASGINNVGGGTAIMTVSDVTRLFVLGSVDESDIGRVQVGQEANITADAFPGKHFSGKVIRVAAKGVNASNVVTFEVKIEVTSENKDLLKLEMTTNVEIVITSKDKALQVPLRAISRKDRKTFLKRQLGPEKTEDVEVKTGINNGAMIEIEGDIKEGDKIVLPPAGSDSRWRSGGDRGGAPKTGGGLLPMPPRRGMR